MSPEFTGLQLAILALIFVWTGFVRSGLGFGGAALGLPPMLLLLDEPLFFLPIIGLHLLFFSSLTAGRRFHNVDWRYVRYALAIMLIPKLAGIAGLLNLPSDWMVIFVFLVSGLYAISWILRYEITSHSRAVDVALLIIGGYISGASLIGAPLIVVVTMRHVALSRFRDTLFVIWFILVSIKLSAFVAVGVDMQWLWALVMIPPALLGHLYGLKVHDRLLSGDAGRVRQWLGAGLLVVVAIGLGGRLLA